MDDQDSRKFRRRAEDRPDEILDAALELFLERGFERTRVDDIARAAGLSKGAVYLYFPTKEAVLEAVVGRAVLPVADQALALIGSYRGDPRPVLARIFEMMSANLVKPGVGRIPRLVLRESLIAPNIAALYRRDVLGRMIPALEGLIRQGVEGGHIRPVDPELTVRSLIGPIIVHVIMAEMFGVAPEGGLGLDKLIANHKAILFAGLEPEKS